MNIRVQYKRVWGKERFYPVSDDAHFLVRLTGKPTLSKAQLKICFEAGHQVCIMQEQIDTKKFLAMDEEKDLSGNDLFSLCSQSKGDILQPFGGLPSFDLPS